MINTYNFYWAADQIYTEDIRGFYSKQASGSKRPLETENDLFWSENALEGHQKPPKKKLQITKRYNKARIAPEYSELTK